MDRISELSDELLIKILLFLPTKVAVSTSLLSKRWECLWMWLPRLEYDDGYYTEIQSNMLQSFLHRNLGLHRAPVLESFCLKSSCSRFKPEDVKLYVLAAVSRIIHELNISYQNLPPAANILPSCLYASKSLVTLKLSGYILLDVPRFVCLASLKTLHLRHVKYFNEETFQRLLSICPVLKHLLVNCRKDDNMGKLSVKVRSLVNLSVDIPYQNDLDGYVIETPSLEHFKLCEISHKSHYCLIENMPKLMEAHVEVSLSDITSLIGAITLVKRLTLCALSKAMYGAGFVFNQLEHLELYTGREYSSILLMRMLKDSPNLRVLDLFTMDTGDERELCCWNQPSTVPECLLSSLQTFMWSEYSGTPQERDLLIYILENARHLKTATIFSNVSQVSRLKMIQELSLSSRASAVCQLEFP